MTSDDDFLRSQLGGSAVSGDANLALAALKPAMKRARRHRHVAAGVLAAAVIGVSGAGVVAVNSSRPAPTLQTSSMPGETGRVIELSQGAMSDDGIDEGADDGGSSLGADAGVVEDETPASSETPALSETSASSELPVSPSSPAPVPGPPPATPFPDAQVPSGLPVTTAAPAVPSTQPPMSTQSAVTTTSTIAPATTTITSVPASGEEIVSSRCGFVTVGFLGDSVSLLNTQPVPGFEVDVKNAGPEEVEVGFAGSGNECEVKARMQSGQFTYSVDNHDS